MSLSIMMVLVLSQCTQAGQTLTKAPAVCQAVGRAFHAALLTLSVVPNDYMHTNFSNCPAHVPYLTV